MKRFISVLAIPSILLVLLNFSQLLENNLLTIIFNALVSLIILLYIVITYKSIIENNKIPKEIR